MLKVGSGGQFCRPRKPSRFDGLVDATSSSSSSASSDSGSMITTEETLYKHYLQVIYTPVSSYAFCLIRYCCKYIVEVIHYCFESLNLTIPWNMSMTSFIWFDDW